MGNRSNSQVVGYRYLLGMHMGISRGPVDELVEIKVGEKVAWRGSVTGNATVNIDAPNLFGGEDGEGGIQGPLTVMMGGPTQTAPAELDTVLSTPMPGFRRRFTAFFDGIVSMINPYPKAWKFRVRRALQGWDGPVWYPERAVISIVRPISAAEQQEANSNTETRTLQGTDTFVGQLPNGYDINGLPIDPVLPFTRTIPLPAGATLVSVDSVAAARSWDDVTNLVLGVDYTVSGNVVTIQPQWDLISITISYTYTITTVIPGAGPGGLGSGLIQAMNPAHIIYECYTNREWGRGLPRDRLNDAAFRTMADALFREGFGLCIRWNRKDEIQAFIQLILDHIGAVVYADRTTGLITPRLIRSDYDRSTLPLFTPESGLVEISDAPVLAQGPLINEIQVKWTDPVTDQVRTARDVNLANLQASGGEINTLSKEYLGLPTYDLATRVAKRDLRSASVKLRKFNFTLDRRGWRVNPGDVVRVADPSRSIGDTVVRVVTVDYGTLREGRIKIQGVQDVFGLPRVGLPTLSPPTYTPPNTQPCVDIARAFELPYYLVRRSSSPGDFAVIDDTSAFLGTVVGQGNPLNNGYRIAVKTGASDITERPPNENFLCGFDLPSVEVDPFFSSVELLLHCDGPNGSAVLVDNGPDARPVTANGSAAISASSPRFGSGALLLSAASSDHLVAPSGGASNFGTGEFTVEAFVRPSALFAGGVAWFVVGTNVGSPAPFGGWRLMITASNTGGRLFFSVVGGQDLTGNIPASGYVPANAWTHIVAQKRGGNLEMYADGVLVGSTAFTASVGPGTTQFVIGRDVQFSSNNFDGMIDEVRVTSGVARYSGPFTPPTAPFPNE